MTILRRFLSSAGSSAPGKLCPPVSPSPHLPPIVYTYLPDPLPYHHGLNLQETLVQRRLSARSALLSSPSESERKKLERIASTDILLLLQHTPVYTTGRRERDPEQLERERKRLEPFGADYVSTMRGGQTTFHGPGQLVGYSIMDLSTLNMSTRHYVSHLETSLHNLAQSYGVRIHPTPHTGVFVSPSSKLGSIGIHIRHRVTLHGFAINVDERPLDWFGRIIACGLDDVSATTLSVVSKNRPESVEEVAMRMKDIVALQYGREMREMTEEEDPEVAEIVGKGVRGELESVQVGSEG